jgi:DNA-binding MarR family transcriptional regulator
MPGGARGAGGDRQRVLPTRCGPTPTAAFRKGNSVPRTYGLRKPDHLSYLIRCSSTTCEAAGTIARSSLEERIEVREKTSQRPFASFSAASSITSSSSSLSRLPFHNLDFGPSHRNPVPSCHNTNGRAGWHEECAAALIQILTMPFVRERKLHIICTIDGFQFDRYPDQLYCLCMLYHKSNEVAVEDFYMALRLLVRRVRAGTPPELQEFSWTQNAVLVRLEKGPATSADLARAEGVRPQSMSTALGLLEKKGLVERKAHPTDGRRINIKLTSRGITLRRNSKEATYAWLAGAIAELGRQEQKTLFKAGELFKRMAEKS